MADLQGQQVTDAGVLEETRNQLREKEATLEDEQRKVEFRDGKVKELEDQLTRVKETIGRLETERTDLIAKIEAGEGVTTAINQLKQENVSCSMSLSSRYWILFPIIDSKNREFDYIRGQ